ADTHRVDVHPRGDVVGQVHVAGAGRGLARRGAGDGAPRASVHGRVEEVVTVVLGAHAQRRALRLRGAPGRRHAVRGRAGGVRRVATAVGEEDDEVAAAVHARPALGVGEVAGEGRVVREEPGAGLAAHVP